MKPFKSIIIVKHPREKVWEVVRDRLDELVPYMDDIQSVAVQNKADMPDGIKEITNIWKADIQLPAILNSVIDSSMLSWTDRAQWQSDQTLCHWEIEPHFFPERTRCTGFTRYEPAIGGRGTRITFEGQLDVSTQSISGMPTFIEGRAATAIESLVTTLIPKNFCKITSALSTLLNCEAKIEA